MLSAVLRYTDKIFKQSCLAYEDLPSFSLSSSYIRELPLCYKLADRMLGYSLHSLGAFLDGEHLDLLIGRDLLWFFGLDLNYLVQIIFYTGNEFLLFSDCHLYDLLIFFLPYSVTVPPICRFRRRVCLCSVSTSVYLSLLYDLVVKVRFDTKQFFRAALYLFMLLYFILNHLGRTWRVRFYKIFLFFRCQIAEIFS